MISSPRALLISVATLMFSVGIASSAFALSTADSWSITSTIAVAEVGKTTINLSECKTQARSGGDRTFTFALKTGLGSPNSGSKYAIKIRIGDEACDETSLEDESGSGDTCYTVVSSTNYTIAPITKAIAWDRLSAAKDEADCETLLESTTHVYLLVSDPDFGELTPDLYTASYDIVFKTKRPDAPTDVSLVVGGQSLKASWTSDSALKTCHIYTSTEALTSGADPDTISAKKTIAHSTTDVTVASLTESTSYFVGVTCVDDNGNESLLSDVQEIMTNSVLDFWEDFHAQNPDVEPGYCFIATAAYGSYQAPHVQVLRDFRDSFLLTNAPGRAFVRAYYASSPPLASWIASSPLARSITRVFLWPLYALAIILLYGGALAPFGLALVFFLSGFLLRRVYRRFRHRRRNAPLAPSEQPAGDLLPGRRRAAVLGFVALLAFAFSGQAHAQKVQTDFSSPVDMMLEFKGGPYTPAGLGDSYTTFFKDESAVLIEAEFDYQFLRGWLGSVGVGVNLGYASIEGKAIDADTGEPSVDSTDLNWMPMRLSVIARLNVFQNLWNVPFTFFAKAGLDYYVWWSNDSSGSISTVGDAMGSGGTFGYHIAIGGAFLLDWLSPRMASGFDAEWGVNNSYLFAEFLLAGIDNFGSDTAFDLSDTGTFQIGLAIEF